MKQKLDRAFNYFKGTYLDMDQLCFLIKSCLFGDITHGTFVVSSIHFDTHTRIAHIVNNFIYFIQSICMKLYNLSNQKVFDTQKRGL